MSTNTKDMTKGKPWKNITIFALPILFSNIFQQLYNTVDSLIVGNILGKESLAAVSSSGSLIFLFVSFFTGTAMGAGVLISKYFGQKDFNNLSRAIHTNVAFGVVASIILTILGVTMAPVMLRWMGTDESVLPESISYFRNYFYGVSGLILYNIFNGILQAVGNSKRGLYYLIISSLLNVVLDYIFIKYFHMGVAGAAIATVISHFVSAILCFLFLIRKGTIYQLQLKKVRFHKDMLKLILKYGLPSGIQNSVIAIANVLVQSNINSFGPDAMAGCGSYSKVEGFAFLPINCFTMAISTFVGQNLGAKEYKRAKDGAKFGIFISLSLSELISIILYIFAPFLIRLFNQEPNVVYFGVKQMRTVCMFYFLLAFSHCIASVCRGAGKAIVPMIIMLSVWCIFRIIYITVAMKISHNIVLLFWAYPITWAISSIIYLFYFLKSNWIHGFDIKKQLNAI